jgi:hypothetical protein
VRNIINNALQQESPSRAEQIRYGDSELFRRPSWASASVLRQFTVVCDRDFISYMSLLWFLPNPPDGGSRREF